MAKIFISAGHSGGDPGNTWGGHHEADLMLELRFITALKLRESGHEVTEDGRRGDNRPLTEAVQMIQGTDLALELHTNASTNTTATGVEVVSDVLRAEVSRRIAHAIGGVLMIPTRRTGGWFPVSQLAGERGFTPGFVRRGGLIVETFFQSNPEDLRKYLERRWLVASAIARAVDAHLRGAP